MHVILNERWAVLGQTPGRETIPGPVEASPRELYLLDREPKHVHDTSHRFQRVEGLSMSLHRTVVLLAIGAFSGACAFTDIPIELPTAGLEHTVSGGKGRQVVVVIPFSDDRTMRNRCGMQKNGYNMDTADAVCQSDPAVWIAQLLSDELRSSGFSVRTTGEDSKESALRVEGKLLKLFVEPIIGAWTGSLEADLSVKLRETSRTGLGADRTFFVKGWKGGMMLSTRQPYQTSLHRATQAMLEEMVRAIIEMMDAYPQLGFADEPAIKLAVLVEGGRG